MSNIPTCIIGSSHITAPVATGGHDPDKYAEVGSFTKVITGTILEQLAREGVLTVDDPVERWLDIPAGSGITLQHLAEHTSGLPRVPPGTTNINPYKRFSDDRLRVLLTAGLDRLTTAPAGEREEYSNFGYAVLGAALTAASSQEYSDLVATHVLSPLGLPPEAMTAHPPEHRRSLASGWFGRSVKPWDMTGAILPAGGLWATPRTVARVLTGLVLDRTLGEPSLSWQRTGPLPLMWHNGGTRRSTIFAGAVPDGRWIVVHRLHGSVEETDRVGLGHLRAATALSETTQPGDFSHADRRQRGERVCQGTRARHDPNERP
ncbi:beta-lactamase family protein [Streptomyces lunaelactis]|uniref:serine hydrolase domain-containing protein n=1 Tax=Streptomyces lunaelactis TaxID=1535768 RepID=UPI00158536FD|nr:serine hydrolase domain-containing protein [Streptomyces lunaelactis]NUK08970.1 beta-lactamase family protein [Streptomyces lunaelactis]NUK34671.1 beta-lactamase family protein [Streptomyces lunaelactis]NUK41532.1 beta-lactamase family protein [Streptomyces lunaelactis]NUK57786.1 beta-lactamase family protein [Streptomyces lunaelactis]NUK91679.1 beta-lactamase family protein [Streptomyces lunaelactis]